MSGKNKLKKFADIATFENVIENQEFVRFDQASEAHQSHPYFGRWNQDVFQNDYPIVLELACGKGEYTIQLAKRYPQKNFIGVDIKGNRIWKGAKVALEQGLKNVRFLRTRIELLEIFFAQDEVSEIWITFPDPHLRKSRIKNRLTAPKFLDLYPKILPTNGILHLKTDDPTLYAYSLTSINEHTEYEISAHHSDIYSLPALPHPDLDIKTFYEKQHLENSLTIKYIAFSHTMRSET